jgi:cytochrome c biogenesis protein CcmG/thiol:disulfide interchange protein DsbE
MLNRMQQGRFDPHDIGNPMLHKPLPDFSLVPVGDGKIANATGFTSAELIAAAHSQPILLNFFASWCIPCAEEAESLDALAKLNIPIWGVTALQGAYKDSPDKIAAFLDRTGNPYQKLGADPTGMLCLNMGLYGVPENFIIGASGHIDWHLAGPLGETSIEQGVLPFYPNAKT